MHVDCLELTIDQDEVSSYVLCENFPLSQSYHLAEAAVCYGVHASYEDHLAPPQLMG